MQKIFKDNYKKDEALNYLRENYFEYKPELTTEVVWDGVERTRYVGEQHISSLVSIASLIATIFTLGLAYSFQSIRDNIEALWNGGKLVMEVYVPVEKVAIVEETPEGELPSNAVDTIS